MRNQKGQSLVEALIALGVATLIVSAMAIAIVTSVNSSDYSKYENLATHYAQQGIQILQQSQSDWAEFSKSDNIGSKCLGDNNLLTPGVNCLLSPSPTANLAGFFIRQVSLVQGGDSSCPEPASIHGKVSVLWGDGKCSSGNLYCHKVVLESCFANINPAKTL
jgi:hypothetical protein